MLSVCLGREVEAPRGQSRRRDATIESWAYFQVRGSWFAVPGVRIQPPSIILVNLHCFFFFWPLGLARDHSLFFLSFSFQHGVNALTRGMYRITTSMDSSSWWFQILLPCGIVHERTWQPGARVKAFIEPEGQLLSTKYIHKEKEPQG